MPATHRVFPEYRFSFTRCYGRIDDNILNILVLNFSIAARGLQRIKALADVRELTDASRITLQGLIKLIELKNERILNQSEQLAILTDDRNIIIHELAKLYAMVTGRPHHEIKIFNDECDALSWLGYSKEESRRIIEDMRKARN